MSVWQKIRGTLSTIFQLGPSGPNLKNNSGVIEARNSADSGYAIVRGSSPVGDNDLVTKAYADTLLPVVVSDQFNGNNALPSNTSTEHFILVTTTGSNASIGQILWDDGTSTGTVTVIAAASGRLITPSVALSGGTVTFNANSIYSWTGSTWQDVGGTSVSGALREIRMSITNAGSQSSATQIPANAIITYSEVKVETPYSGGATIQLGISGTTNLFQDTGDSVATVAGEYGVPQDTSVGSSAAALLVTVGGSPSAGAGHAIVRYTVPNA